MSNMNTFLVLMCSIAILSTPLCGAQSSEDEDDFDITSSTDGPISNTAYNIANITEVSRLESTASPAPASQSQSPSAPVTTTPKGFTFKELRTAYLVAGGLILLCFLLLLSTSLLADKVCRLSRRIKELSSDTDLVVTSDYHGAQAKPEKDPEEITVLMSDLSQTKEDLGNDTKEEAENKTEDGDKNMSEEAAATPAAAAESPPPSEGPEETSESPSAEATAASNSEGPGEPKDVV